MGHPRDDREKKKAEEDLRQDILAYIRTYSLAKKEAPSIRMILKKVGTNRTIFYSLFASLNEACELAGVSTPKDRNVLVRPALEAKRNQDREQVAPKEDPKETLALILGEFERDIERSKNEAILDPSKIAEYVSKVLPLLDPILWSRLELLDGDLKMVVWAAMLFKEKYLELLKRYKVTGEKAPDFTDYIVGALRDHVSYAMKNQGYASAPPGKEYDTCYRCGSQLWYSSGADEPLYCRTCDQLRTSVCEVCGSIMGQLPPKMLQCGSCGHRTQFAHEPRTQIASIDDYVNQLIAGKIPPEEYRNIFFTQRLPDGKCEYTPVTLLPGSVPGTLVQKMHFDQAFIADC